MTLFRTILAATDFSPAGDNAVRRAALLAHQLGAQLSLLHVVEDGALHSLLPVSDDRTLKMERARETLRRMARDLNAAHALQTTVTTRAGDVFEELLHAAQGVDLVVLGHRGRSRFKHLLIGRTASRFLRCSTGSVLAVKKPAAAPYRRVLAAFDFAPCSHAAAHAAAQLGEQGIVQAFHALDARRDARLRSIDRAEHLVRAARAREEAGIGARLRRSLARQGLDSRLIGVTVGRGQPAPAVLAQARDWGADLIVAGKQGHSTIARFLLGSVSRQLLVESDCDTLIAPPPAQQAVARAAPSRSSPRSAPEPRERMDAT